MRYPIGAEVLGVLAKAGYELRRLDGGVLSAYDVATAQRLLAELLTLIREKHPQLALTPPVIVPMLPPESLPLPAGDRVNDVPRVCIVTGTYNRIRFLQDLVGSIRRHAGVSYCLIVVDGGSTDGTRDWVREQPDCHLLEQEGPLSGAVAAFNMGFAYAVDLGSPYIAHLNDDVVLETPNTFGWAINLLEAHPHLGEVAFAFDLRGPHAFESIHGYVYANFGLVRREAGMAVARMQGDPDGKRWWHPIYRTYGADCEFACWLWQLGWAIHGEPGIKIHDRTRETQDELRQLNGSNDPNRSDTRLFWSRWPTADHVKTIGPVG